MADKWIQKASDKMERKGTTGDFTKWCKSHGHEGVNCKCISEARAAGGRAAKMANFANNAGKKNC